MKSGRWRRRLRPAGRFILASGIVIFAGVAGFLAAYVIDAYEGKAVELADRVGEGVARRWKAAFGLDSLSEGGQDGARLSSVFVPLRADIVTLPKPDRPGEGGSLTSFGEDVVVITHDGTFWLIDETGTAARSAIEAPFNGFDDYVTASKRPPFDRLTHEYKVFRYNDITRFEMGGQHGLIVSYTRFYADRTCFTTVVSRLDMDAGVKSLRGLEASANDWKDVFETAPCLPFKDRLYAIEGHEAGGAIVFDGAGTLYLASGDYGWDGMQGPRVRPGADPQTAPVVPQDPVADYGKVIAIDIETGAARHVSRGHRNTQGITLDSSGRLWVTEHGPRGGDELNLIVEGGNYGWPFVAYGVRYAMLALPGGHPLGSHAGFQRPMIAWLPAVGISGLEHVDGFHEAWDGDMVATSLVGQKLIHIRVAEGRVTFTEFIETGRRIRQVHQHTDGRLVLWSSLHEVIFLEPARESPGLKHVEARLAEMDDEQVPVERLQAAIQSCLQCHSLDVGDHGNAPSLALVFGARVGTTGFGGYSNAMRRDERIWTRDLLAAYLRDPQAVVPGTTMPDPGLQDERVIGGIIELLESLATID